jgi:hypothetical protein
MFDVFGEARKHRPDAVEYGRFAADQEIELSLMGVSGRARHRRVEIVAAGVFDQFPHADGRFGQCRRAIHNHRTTFQPGDDAVFAGQDRLDLRRAGHA